MGFSIGKLTTEAAGLIRESKPIKPERDSDDVSQSLENLIQEVISRHVCFFSSLDVSDSARPSLKGRGSHMDINTRRQGSS